MKKKIEKKEVKIEKHVKVLTKEKDMRGKKILGFIPTIAMLKDKYRPTQTILVEMLHTNGTVSHYVISSKIHKFNWNNMVYIIDEERKEYCTTSKMFILRYHEGFVLPFSLEVSAIEMKSNLPDDTAINEIATSFNPYVLKDVLKFEYAKGVIQGAEVSEFIKRGFIMAIITLVAVMAHFIAAAYKGGWI